MIRGTEIPGQAQSHGGKENPAALGEAQWGAKISSEVNEATLSRKAAIAIVPPVPQTDTGRRGENPKADGRSVVKELGKMAP